MQHKEGLWGPTSASVLGSSIYAFLSVADSQDFSKCVKSRPSNHAR